MPKKKKPAMAIGDRLALHMSISNQLTTLMARCAQLRDTGKTSEARRLLKRIERLASELRDLENKK